MSSCKDIAALMMDWLYDELDPAQKRPFDEHVEDCAQCKAELASLMQTRQMFSALPAQDPPASVSAILLHEAAKHAPKSGRSSFLVWLSGLFSPIVAHPAAAAVATLVLVAGVAGTLYVRGDKQIAEPTHRADDSSASPMVSTPGRDLMADNAPAAPAGKDPTDPEQWDDQAGNPAPSVPETGEASPDPDRPYRADLLAAEDSKKLGLPELDSEAEEQRAPRDQADTPRPRPGKSGRGKLLARREVSNKSDKAGPVATGNSATEGLISGDEEPVGFGLGDVTAKPEGKPSGVRGGLEVSPPPVPASQPAKKAARVERSAIDEKSKTKQRRTRGMQRPAQDPRAPASTKDSDVAVVQTRSQAPVAAKGKSAWAQNQQKRLSRALQAKRCNEAARIANDIQDRDPAYYRRNIAGSSTLKPCSTMIAREQSRRRAARKRAKAAEAEAAAEADEAAADSAE